MKYFIDTCIWIDLMEDRIGRDGNPFGNHAARFFLKMVGKTIFTSDITIKELKQRFSNEEIHSMMLPFKVSMITASKEQFDEAIIVSEKLNVPKGDALHAIIARDNKLLLVTRDKHFEKLCEHKRPEDLI